MWASHKEEEVSREQNMAVVWKRRPKEGTDLHSPEITQNRRGLYHAIDNEATLQNYPGSPAPPRWEDFDFSFEELTRCSKDMAYGSTTYLKWPVSSGDTSQDQTYPVYYHSSESEDDSEMDELTSEDKQDLLKRMEMLEKEQEELKRRQENHEASWKELLNKGGPCFQKSLKSISRSFRTKMRDCPPPVPPKNGNQALQNMIDSTDAQIHVQLEQLYTNFHVLHFPTQKRNFVNRDNNNNGLTRLKEENNNLKCNIEELKMKLRQMSMSNRAPSPPPGFSSLRVESGMKPAKSESRLDEMKSPIPIRRRPNYVTGRPISTYQKPAIPKDIYPMEVIFKWTISDYQKKFNMETFRDGNPQISEPFYLTHCGFKAQMEAYLNGNGTARHRCLSVFLRILKGDYDSTLKWPANLHVTVTLLNQSGSHLHCLKTGGNQFQYNRPSGSDPEEGECWGLIDFVNHEQIRHGHFIKDDKIVLVCTVKL